MFGPTEMMVIAVLAIVLFFGASKLPELARSLGQAMGEFKKAQREAELDYKRFEKSVAGKYTEELPKSKDVNIREVAEYMGIDTEDKTEEELKEEIQAKLESSKKE